MSAQAVRVDQENAAVDTAEVAGGFATTLSRLEEYGIAASDIKKLNVRARSRRAAAGRC